MSARTADIFDPVDAQKKTKAGRFAVGSKLRKKTEMRNDRCNTFYAMCSFACAAGYPDSILKQYADVFQKILDNDKHLQGQEWDSHKVYENDNKYFGKGDAE